MEKQGVSLQFFWEIFVTEADNKIKVLLEEGGKTKCEDENSVKNLEDLNVMPEWFDEEKFKR